MSWFDNIQHFLSSIPDSQLLQQSRQEPIFLDHPNRHDPGRVPGIPHHLPSTTKSLDSLARTPRINQVKNIDIGLPELLDVASSQPDILGDRHSQWTFQSSRSLHTRVVNERARLTCLHPLMLSGTLCNPSSSQSSCQHCKVEISRSPQYAASSCA